MFQPIQSNIRAPTGFNAPGQRASGSYGCYSPYTSGCSYTCGSPCGSYCPSHCPAAPDALTTCQCLLAAATAKNDELFFHELPSAVRTFSYELASLTNCATRLLHTYSCCQTCFTFDPSIIEDLKIPNEDIIITVPIGGTDVEITIPKEVFVPLIGEILAFIEGGKITPETLGFITDQVEAFLKGEGSTQPPEELVTAILAAINAPCKTTFTSLDELDTCAKCYFHLIVQDIVTGILKSTLNIINGFISTIAPLAQQCNCSLRNCFFQSMGPQQYQYRQQKQ
jgi:hypothetical protein